MMHDIETKVVSGRTVDYRAEWFIRARQDMLAAWAIYAAHAVDGDKVKQDLGETIKAMNDLLDKVR